MYIIVLTETQMKLWIKIIRNEKIIKDTVTEGNAENAKELHALLADVCDRLELPRASRHDHGRLQSAKIQSC